MINKGMFTSNCQTWGTPQSLFNKLNEEFNFNIDLCADLTNYKIKPYYSIKENSLMQSWDNVRGWLNPPYGREQIAFIKKAYNARNSIIVALIPARTDTRLWHDYVMKAREIRFIKGRIKFENELREAGDPAPFPSAIVVFDGMDHNPTISSYEQ